MCVRVTQIVLMISLFLLLLISIMINSGGDINPWVIIFFYYSLWGMMISLFSVIFTIWANYTDRAFIVAFYLVEASLAANLFIFIFYWGAIFWVLRATLFKDLWEQDKKETYYWLLTYQVLVHVLPLLSTLLNILVTRIKPRRSDWFRMILVLFPLYMFANVLGGLTVGNGTIYQVENWKTQPGVSFLIFIGVGLLQGGIYYLAAWAFEKLREKHDYEAE